MDKGTIDHKTIFQSIFKIILVFERFTLLL